MGLKTEGRLSGSEDKGTDGWLHVGVGQASAAPSTADTTTLQSLRQHNARAEGTSAALEKEYLRLTAAPNASTVRPPKVRPSNQLHHHNKIFREHSRKIQGAFKEHLSAPPKVFAPNQHIYNGITMIQIQ
jgi:hypothetical protein